MDKVLVFIALLTLVGVLALVIKQVRNKNSIGAKIQALGEQYDRELIEKARKNKRVFTEQDKKELMEMAKVEYPGQNRCQRLRKFKKFVDETRREARKHSSHGRDQ